MKKKIIKKLTLNKEDISNLSQEDANNLRGGNAPTYVDPAHGGNCTNTCGGGDPSMAYFTCPGNPDGVTNGCSGGCPSVRQTGCPDGTLQGLCSAAAMCFTRNNCTYADCTQGCPTTYGDATCTH